MLYVLGWCPAGGPDRIVLYSALSVFASALDQLPCLHGRKKETRVPQDNAVTDAAAHNLVWALKTSQREFPVTQFRLCPEFLSIVLSPTQLLLKHPFGVIVVRTVTSAPTLLGNNRA